MYELKEFQERKVVELLNYTCEALTETGRQHQILLEAPTGSGKTVMMAALIERLAEETAMRPGLPHELAFIWFAPNTLHIQSYESLQELYSDTRRLNCIDLSFLSGSPALNDKDLLFINWSSVDSLNKIWRRDNEQNTNLETLIAQTQANGVETVLVIDEAHLSAFTGKQATAVRNLIKAKVEISVTATPKQRPQRSVFISRQEVIAAQMIKKGVRLNVNLDPEQQMGDNVHVHLLRVAMQKKAELKALFDAEAGADKVNPLILIQLPSENSALSEEDKTVRDIVVGLLATDFGISSNNGRLAIWLAGEKDKDGIEEINAMQDVLIFKQAIAQGWNCPRASILVNYRSVKSPDFGIQTVGRILRMPHHKHYLHDDLNYGYVYSNIPSSQVNFVPSDTDYIHTQLAMRKKELVFQSINSAFIVNDRPTKGSLTFDFPPIFNELMEETYGIRELPEYEPELFEVEGDDNFKHKIAANRQAMQNKMWVFDIDDHQISLPTDLQVDPYAVNAYFVDREKMKDFTITPAEFEAMLNKFCFDSITRLNRSKSWKVLRRTLIEFAEYYLNMFEIEARKFFMFPQNNHFLSQHIAEALERFEIWQKEIGNVNRRAVEKSWEVPEFRYYSEVFKPTPAERHALEPFFEQANASSPEQAFRTYLESQSDQIEWWYKNGDSGKEHFAVPYTDSRNEMRLFYVDFVIKLKNGSIALYDTKTKRSDHEAPRKHNALIEYMEKENAANTHRKLIGGVIIPETIGEHLHFRWCRNRIADTNDLTGWDFFDPAATQ
jgi:type III restriction enzyme